jgi:hypothetical protein
MGEMKKVFFLVLLVLLTEAVYSQVPGPPILISPTNGATGLNPDNILLDWHDVTGALKYRFQVFEGTFKLIDDSVFTNSQYQIPVGSIPANTSFYWYVNVTTLGGTSGWSTSWSFTTGLNVPTSPILLIPMNGETGVPINVTFDWSSVAGATSYILHASKTQTFDSLVVNHTTTISNASITLEYNTIYYWKMCALNYQGVGPWSIIFHFTTMTQVPPAPVLLYPCGVSNVPLTSTLDWTDVATSTGYRLQISLNNTFNTFIINTTTSVSEYPVQPGVLNYSTMYYWNVAAISTGGQGSFSNVCSFSTMSQVGVNQISSEIPAEYKLFDNYPNPFNPNTIIRFQIKDSRLVTLKVFDILGREVEMLVNEKQTPGTYEVNFNASNLPSGIYFYTLRSGDFTDTKKMLLIK